MKFLTQPTAPTVRHPLKAMWYNIQKPEQSACSDVHGDARRASRLRSLLFPAAAIMCLGALVLLSGCAQTITPKPIVSTQASVDPTGQNSGIIAFYKDHLMVSQHWIDRYHLMVKLNDQKPDMVNGSPNPNKVFIAGKEDLGVVLRPDGNYDVTYITLFYFDRLNASQKSNRRS